MTLRVRAPHNPSLTWAGPSPTRAAMAGHRYNCDEGVHGAPQRFNEMGLIIFCGTSVQQGVNMLFGSNSLPSLQSNSTGSISFLLLRSYLLFLLNCMEGLFKVCLMLPLPLAATNGRLIKLSLNALSIYSFVLFLFLCLVLQLCIFGSSMCLYKPSSKMICRSFES